MHILVKLFLMVILAAPAQAQYAPVVWPAQGWPAPWPQIVWVPVLPPYFMWPVPQWPAMPMTYPAEPQVWPTPPLLSPALPDMAAGVLVPGITATSDASASTPALLPDAPKAETLPAMAANPASAPSVNARPDNVPAAKKAVEAIEAKAKPKAKRSAAITVKSKAKPRRLCWSNGVVDACPK